jgi:hypothetical protein
LRNWGISTAGVLSVALFVASCTLDFSAGTDEPDSGPTCGNGDIESGEECDGENHAGRTCDTEEFGGGSLACTSSCTLDVTGCVDGCGNGVVDGTDECDDGADNSDSAPNACRTTCQSAWCGDGVVDEQEACDSTDLAGETCVGLGLLGGDLACAMDCAGFDVSGCDIATFCGNGVIDPPEVCDGSGLGGATCVSLGFEGGELACAPDCLSLNSDVCLRVDGEPCLADAQCDGGLCLDEVLGGYPSGICTRPCSSDDCGDLVCGKTLAGTEYCFGACESSADCRPGYACFAPLITGTPYCYPHCEADSDCPATLDCNPWTGFCNDPVVGAENGITCLGGDPCRSNFCSFDYPDGYCVSFCDVSSGVCPGDGECADIFGSIGADLGMCLDGCLVQSDCPRMGYSCITNPYGTGSVCLSP